MNSRATSATGQHALMDSLELSLRNLRDCWPEPWPGLALVFDRCVQRLGWSADGSSPRLQALTRAAHAIAAEIERDGRARMQQGQEPEYHNRLHIADTLVCMTHLLLAHRQARPGAVVTVDSEYLGLVVMLGHDFLHSGQVNRFPGELESLAVSQLQPILRQHGVQPEDIETIGHCILKTDPTGVRQSHELIVGRPFVLDDRDCLVVLVDEAYVDFGAETAVPLVQEHPNLLVVQTFSKSRALAGLRVGFAIGQPELLAGLERVKNSFNSYPVDRLASAGGIAAIEDRTGFEHDRQRIIESRQWLNEQLAGLGFGHANNVSQ